MALSTLPVVVYDGLGTCLVLRGSQYLRHRPGTLELCNNKEVDKADILAEYPVKRWAELMLAGIEKCCIMAPQSVVKILRALTADPIHEYTLEHFSKESIMATSKKAAAEATSAPAAKKAAAAKPDAKAANAAAAAPAAKPAKAPKADAAAKGGTKAATPAAVPAKQPAKAAKAAAAEGGEGRKGRPSPHALDAVLKKGTSDFKEHVREGTHRYFRYDFLVKNIGKKVEDVLGKETEDGVAIVSKHISGAIEAGYITLSK
jgi:hypothetical protein